MKETLLPFIGTVTKYGSRRYFLGEIKCCCCGKSNNDDTFYQEAYDKSFLKQPIWYREDGNNYLIFCGYECANDSYLKEKHGKEK